WYRLPHPALSGEAGRSLHDPFGATIVVPFPWESYLSEVRAPDYKGAAWYQRTITVPAEWAEEGAAQAAEAPLPPLGGEGFTPGPSPGLPPARWRLRPHLCFGAVDWNAKV